MTTTDTSINLTDVPPVSARELIVAVKLLALHGATLDTAHTMSDSALRNVFTAYWNMIARDGARKSATLVRLQNLINVCSSRRMAALIEAHGRAGIFETVTVAATCRLNTTYGFNPLKIARAVRTSLAVEEPAAQEFAQAA